MAGRAAALGTAATDCILPCHYRLSRSRPFALLATASLRPEKN
jgi:hypothetical protein